MILVDTSIWIDHFRSPMTLLVHLLENSRILGHPWITSELALGNLSNRDRILALLESLPQAPVIQPDPLLAWIHETRLSGLGLGLVDAQVLASCVAHSEVELWTRDRRLGSAAEVHGCRFVPPQAGTQT
ncbi:MAG TPA: PIN domain-containing protein [Thermomicrobiales bacterium]|nr:PIN domain-containing protein [Thermomicrobiales bacterium]